MAKPCRNVTGTATNSHHEREAILPSEKERVELCRYIVIWNFYLRFMVVSLGLISTDRICKQSTSSAFYR
uniref:Uncharacterized protein n=1 Tax=Brassica oleracea TaxID=3712 RepID=A0A3P6C062_BRAOL|nr:unnamed protein product [Brassica oleracea]